MAWFDALFSRLLRWDSIVAKEICCFVARRRRLFFFLVNSIQHTHSHAQSFFSVPFVFLLGFFGFFHLSKIALVVTFVFASFVGITTRSTGGAVRRNHECNRDNKRQLKKQVRHFKPTRMLPVGVDVLLQRSGCLVLLFSFAFVSQFGIELQRCCRV